MDLPLEICEARDPKGLYKLARAGKIKGTGQPFGRHLRGFSCSGHLGDQQLSCISNGTQNVLKL
jgi:hypothetical protein